MGQTLRLNELFQCKKVTCDKGVDITIIIIIFIEETFS